LQAKKPKILSLVWYKFLPAQFGGQQRIASFNEALGKQTELICLCSKKNVIPTTDSYAVFPLLPNSKLQVINPFTWLFIIQFCKKEKITHIIIEHPYHVISAWLLHVFFNIKIIHASHNIEFQRFKLLKKWYWEILFYAEKWLCSFAQLNIFITEQDQQTAIEQFKIAPKKCLVVPNGITPKNIQSKAIVQQQIKLAHQILEYHAIFLFNGTLDYAPNAKAVEDIAANLIPALNHINKEFTIIVTGRIETPNFQYLSNLTNSQLKILGNVSNIEDYFLAADVYINTVKLGGGVQTKTLEALSYHLNVVCFKHMLNGIELAIASNKLFTVDENNWKDFAQKTWQAYSTAVNTTPEFYEYYEYDKYIKEVLKRIK
jgi:glycosyltransferase involved in cell wall biosynthesis